MDLGLAGRVALVTGGSRGLGLAPALGRVDILVAHAGGPPRGGLLDTSDEDWESALARNPLRTIRLMRAAVPAMWELGWGRIVTTTSASAREALTGKSRSEAEHLPFPGEPEAHPGLVLDALALSNATRPGVAGAVRRLAREVAADGVRVSNVMPGPILTDRLRKVAGDEEALARRAALNPARRLGRPEEVGELVAFLAGDRAAFVNGASIPIDGGEAWAVASATASRGLATPLERHPAPGQEWAVA